jgi:predicted alpha/beta hydrolase family esterase
VHRPSWQAQLRDFVSEKRFWIYTKLAEKDRLQRQVPRKEFVGGEGFLYLGRTHRLKLVDEQDVPLKLANGRFTLRRDAGPPRGSISSAGTASEPVSGCRPCGRLSVTHGGSTCGRKGAGPGLSLGLMRQGRLAVLPLEDNLAAARIAEYVVVHEIAHLHEPHHTPAFWLRVERAMPDYAQRRPGWLSTELMSRGYRTGPLADLVRGAGARARRVSGIDWEEPVLPHWAQAVRDGIDHASGPVWLVAHSFGCLAAVLAASSRREQVAGLMLVAPADPERFTPQGLRDARTAPEQPSLARWIPRSPLGAPSLVVASTNDPWVRLSSAAYWAQCWGSQLENIGAAGHINVDSGHGPWPRGWHSSGRCRRRRATSPLAPSHAAPGAVTASRLPHRETA